MKWLQEYDQHEPSDPVAAARVVRSEHIYIFWGAPAGCDTDCCAALFLQLSEENESSRILFKSKGPVVREEGEEEIDRYVRV